MPMLTSSIASDRNLHFMRGWSFSLSMHVSCFFSCLLRMIDAWFNTNLTRPWLHQLEQEFEPIRQPRLFQVQGKFFQTWIVLQDLASQNLRWWEILWSLWILPYCSSWCIMLVYRRCISTYLILLTWIRWLFLVSISLLFSLSEDFSF